MEPIEIGARNENLYDCYTLSRIEAVPSHSRGHASEIHRRIHWVTLKPYGEVPEYSGGINRSKEEFGAEGASMSLKEHDNRMNHALPSGSGKNGISSTSTSKIPVSEDVTSDRKGFPEQESLEGHVGSQSSTFYNYYYPGFDGSAGQFGDAAYYHADGLQSVTQAETGPLLAYYWPGYNPYTSGALMGVDEPGVSPQQYFSSGYLQPLVSYGLEAVPYYPWDSTYVGDVSTESIPDFKNSKPVSGSSAFMKSAEHSSMKTKAGTGSQSSRSTNVVPLKSLSKVPQQNPLGSDNSTVLRVYDSARKNSSFNGQRHGVFHNNYRSNGRGWNQYDRYKKFNSENSMELTRGPRSQAKNAPLDSFIKDEEFSFAVRRDQYNRPDFQTKYENAKFFIIKSYSEDDIHKCVKYDVWSSTPNGNKKLDGAFHDVEAGKLQNNTEYPIFLFFSVNGSGQFVGVAEMVGRVDFNKDMDFWQLDKWNGFFPVKWHIIKDIPNNQLRHIVLENNDNQSVTFSRDTQEVGLRQGLEMLNIFMSYPAKTSLLDDFSFYENREKSLNSKKNKPATLRMDMFKEDDLIHKEAAERNDGEGFMRPKRGSADADSLVKLTRNLSLGGSSIKRTAVKNNVKNPPSSVTPP